jgi:hypothetical protein
MRRAAYLIVLVPLALAVGCTSSTSTPPVSSAVSSPASPPTSSASTQPTSVDTATEESLTPSSTPSPSKASPAGGPICLAKNLHVDALPGSGASGRQFATILFTNTGTAVCTMTGSPQVTLLRTGKALGKPAVASSKPVTAVKVMPGKSADTTITGFSTCNAPNSDAVRIAAPGQNQTVDAPLELRACQLEVDPVSATTG